MYYPNVDEKERRQVCACGKVCFDKRTAQSKKNYLEKLGKARKLRIYACPVSDFWHLTSKHDWYNSK